MPNIVIEYRIKMLHFLRQNTPPALFIIGGIAALPLLHVVSYWLGCVIPLHMDIAQKVGADHLLSAPSNPIIASMTPSSTSALTPQLIGCSLGAALFIAIGAALCVGGFFSIDTPAFISLAICPFYLSTLFITGIAGTAQYEQLFLSQALDATLTNLGISIGSLVGIGATSLAAAFILTR
ncbi:MAG: hypothetical protein JSS50_01615 [Proteobacteria bacterium]|nr:hypothetical protein [Pseudomonadota bacterium]